MVSTADLTGLGAGITVSNTAEPTFTVHTPHWPKLVHHPAGVGYCQLDFETGYSTHTNLAGCCCYFGNALDASVPRCFRFDVARSCYPLGFGFGC